MGCLETARSTADFKPRGKNVVWMISRVTPFVKKLLICENRLVVNWDQIRKNPLPHSHSKLSHFWDQIDSHLRRRIIFLYNALAA